MYLDDDFKQWLQSLMDEHHVPGMSVAVVHDGQVEAAGYGLAALPDTPATADTIYSMGSTTKAFAATLMGLLIQDSKQKEGTGNGSDAVQSLDWTTPVKSILGHDFETADPYITANVNFEDMLSHRTGVPGHDLLWGPWLKSPAGVAQLVRYLNANEPFRAKCQYNNIMYGTVGHAVEKITGQDWGDAVRERIFKPLDMHKTYTGVEEASEYLTNHPSDSSMFARGYHWISTDTKHSGGSTSKNQPDGYYVADPGFSVVPINPAGAILSNVLDYAKWTQELLKASADPATENKEQNEISVGKDHEKRLISNDLWKELTTPRTFWPSTYGSYPDVTPQQPNAHVNLSSYALGWMADHRLFPSQVLVRHGGGLPSFGSDVSLFPNLNFGVVAAGNTAGTSNKLCEFIVKELAGRRLDVPKEERRRRHEQKEKKDANEADKPHYNARSPNFAHDEMKLTSKPVESSGQGSQSDDVSIFYLGDRPVSMATSFRHPAYGSFSVSIAPQDMSLSCANPSNNGVSITRNHPGVVKRERTPNDVEQPHTVHLRPNGFRSVITQFILHPSAISDDKIVYDLEQMTRHGLPDVSRGDFPDPFSSLPPGHGREGDPRYPYRDTQIWSSDVIKLNGAVLVLREEDSNGVKGYSVEKMGIKLARVDEPKHIENGVLETGWEKRLEWFTPAFS